MKKLFIWLPALMLGLGLWASCSEEKESAAEESNNVEVSFQLNLSDITSRTLTDETDDGTNVACPDPDGWYCGDYEATILIDLNGDEDCRTAFKAALIQKTDGTVVTDKIILIKPTSGKHTLHSILITKKDDPTKVIFATVNSTSDKYKGHVDPDHLMPKDLVFGEDLDVFTKPVIPISLLCAVYDEAPDFGFSIWGLNFVKVVCFDYVINIPEDPCNMNSQDIVGSSDIELIKTIKKGDGSDYQMVHEGHSGDGVKGTICFNDQGNIPDDEEVYTMNIYIPNKEEYKVLLTANLTVEQLYNYKKSGYWVSVDGTPNNGIIHFDLYDAPLTEGGASVPLESESDEEYEWSLIVSTPWPCPEEDCVKCEIPFLSDFKTFTLGMENPGKCDWIAPKFSQCNLLGWFRHEGKLSSMNGHLETPCYAMKAGDKFGICMEDFGCGEVKVLLVNTDGVVVEPTEAMSMVGGKRERVFTVPSDDCYRIRICADGCIIFICINSMEYMPKDVD